MKKKILSIFLMLVLTLSLCACGKTDPNAPEAPKTDAAGSVVVYLDGVETATIKYTDFKKKAESKKFDDTYYYGATLKTILKDVDFSTVKAAFSKADDGYATYSKTPAECFLSAFKADDTETYQESVNLLDESSKNKNVTEIYLLTKPVDFSVEITKNGEPYKTVTIDDFMALKPTYKTMSHLYNYGDSTFEGSFLTVDSKTILEALGITYGDGDSLEFYDKTGKLNKDLKGDPTTEKSPWIVNYYVLVNGNTYHEISSSDVGLSCMIDGTGMRWMVNNLSKVNWVTADAAK